MDLKVNVNGTCWIKDICYPAIGFGTYPFSSHPLKEEDCLNAVVEACKSGYRIFDTATFYQNFIPVGNGLKASGIKRENFYIISKVWPNAHTPEKLQQDLKKTLNELQMSYIDAYLLHWPNSQASIEDVLQTMEELKGAGLIRHIGLSNVNINHLKRALELKVDIEWVQIEMHPLFCDLKLLKFCIENSIGIQAWAPLGRGRLSKDLILERVGNKYNKTAAQIALKWIIQHNCIPLPGSKNPAHIKQNINIGDFTLSYDEMGEINFRAADGQRERITVETGIGFTDEFDFSYEECWPLSNQSNK